LRTIEQGNSLRQGSAHLGISYSKAYAMISTLEKKLGMKVLQRKRGGAERLGSTLTEFGVEFVALYDEFQTSATKALAAPFAHFSTSYADLWQRHKQKEPNHGD
jgi:molybdate transport system regulatory protein